MTTFPLLAALTPAELSPEQSADVATRVASLAKAGLPLESGLRALADEVPAGRLRRLLGQLADRLASGVPLETAIAGLRPKLPDHVRGLVVAGIYTGRLPMLLEEFVRLTHSRRALRRRAVSCMAYPTLLLGILTLLATLLHVWILPEFAHLYKDFGTKLPDLTYFVLNTSGIGPWLLGTMTALLVILPMLTFLMPASPWLANFLLYVPILGPIIRWSCQAQFARLMAMLLEQEVPLPEALRLAAAGMPHAGLAVHCRDAAIHVEQGLSLEAAMAAERFPPSLTALVAWGRQPAEVAETFRSAADMFDQRAWSHGTLLEVVLPPLTFLFVTALAGVLMLALMLPLISLISNLSGGG
jgi:general secretion pathway protein F